MGKIVWEKAKTKKYKEKSPKFIKFLFHTLKQSSISKFSIFRNKWQKTENEKPEKPKPS